MMMMAEDAVIAENRSITTMEAILVRDQRTTSHRVLDRAAQRRASTSTMLLRRAGPEDNASRLYTEVNAKRTDRRNDQRHLRCDSRFVPAFYDDRGIRLNCNVITTTWLKLGCLLTILLLASVHSAPVMAGDKNWRWSIPPKWVNPCGLSALDSNGDADVAQLQDKQLVSQIIVQARTALMHTESFRNNYIKEAFNTDFNDLHLTWQHHSYDWLPRIPKKLGEELEKEYLDNLKLDEVLLDAYQNMQIFAVALEQMVWDREDPKFDQNPAITKNFKDTEFKLRTVLCELQVALIERGVPLREDIERSIMPDNMRELGQSKTFRDLRDWLIFRDYINALEYLVQVLEYLYSTLKS